MSLPVFINGTDAYSRYKARLLDYSVGAVALTNSYLDLPNSIIPRKLKESIGVRKITIEFEFEGESIHDALLQISNMTAELILETEIELPDGFYYYCVMDKASAPVWEGGTFYSVKFTMVGYRHGAMQSETLTESGAITALGNYDAPAIITIENASGTVTVNDITVNDIKATVVINGFDKTVFETDGVVTSNKYKDCEMTKFPSLKAGVNLIDISGSATVKIEYKPIYL